MFLYRILLTLAAPWFAVRLWREGRAAFSERLGAGGQGARAGAVIWLHAASNGEVTAAHPLIEAMLARDPRLHLVVTCNSVTGRALVQGWGLPRVTARLAPLDYASSVRSFIGNWQPDALILIESELWPNRMLEMQALRRPVLVLSARMSARSARIWARLPGLAKRVMGAIDYLSAQDAASEARFTALGVEDGRIGPALNLKIETATGTLDPAECKRLAPLLPREATFLAASTHAGEDAVILRGFHAALEKRPDLKLILAPRHPRRSAEVQALITRAGLPFATRSKGEVPDAQTPVFLVDTLGEMPLWYSLAATVFVGGSLVNKGGHTPFEPAAHECALLHGPHLENFGEVYAALSEDCASRTLHGADDLTDALLTLDAPTRKRMTDRANAVIDDMQSSAGLPHILEQLAHLTGDSALQQKQPKDFAT